MSRRSIRKRRHLPPGAPTRARRRKEKAVAVYVDKLVPYPHARNACFRSGACHMVADTRAELHAMAEKIGLRRAWFQAPPKASIPHYDLTASRRERAVAFGAIEVDRYAFVAKMRELRAAEWP